MDTIFIRYKCNYQLILFLLDKIIKFKFLISIYHIYAENSYKIIYSLIK